jgi:Flp pilus assembly protein TadD/5-hydroxyisourate hydrolase-like protein (transthyretin family)
MFQHIQALTLVLLFSFSVLAQRERETWTTGPMTLEVAGQVRDGQTGEPARNVQVRLERFSGGLAEQMATDEKGKFRFSGLGRGYYNVIVVAPGYVQTQQTADLQVVFKQYLAFELRRQPTSDLGGASVIDARIPELARKEYFDAHTALAEKRSADVIRHLETALGIHPAFFEARLMLATAYMDQRDWKKAEGSFKLGHELKPTDGHSLLGLGEVYWRQKRYDEAEKTLLDGLKIEDKSWHGHFTLGRLYWERGNIAKAAPAIGRTLQLKPDFAEAHLLAGNILLRLEQRERALVEYQEYLRLEPKGEFAAPTRELVTKLSKVIVENKKSLN